MGTQLPTDRGSVFYTLERKRGVSVVAMGGQSFFHECLILGRKTGIIEVQRLPDEHLTLGDRKDG